jgi:hypothetical protein
MRAQWGLGNRWRRFNRKHGTALFIVGLVGLVVILVGFLMYMLTSPNWRPRW